MAGVNFLLTALIVALICVPIAAGAYWLEGTMDNWGDDDLP